jgi:hypothetical protein
MSHLLSDGAPTVTGTRCSQHSPHLPAGLPVLYLSSVSVQDAEGLLHRIDKLAALLASREAAYNMLLTNPQVYTHELPNQLWAAWLCGAVAL